MKSKISLFKRSSFFIYLFISFTFLHASFNEDQIKSIRSDLISLREQLDHLTLPTQGKETYIEKHSHRDEVENLRVNQPTEQNIVEDDTKAFSAHYNGTTARFGGKFTEELFVSGYLNYLNHAISNDSSFFIRTTMDYYMDFISGKCSKPRVMIHETFRFRYRWGGSTDVKVADGTVQVVDANIFTKGAQVNKHLVWSREAWIKLALGNLDIDNNHFVQLGLFPFQLGRGISLGPAYQVSGFLGFTPGFSIDQFAPGALLHINPIPEKVDVDFYVGLLINQNASFSQNQEIIRSNEITGCSDGGRRGLGRQTYLIALRSLCEVYGEKERKMSFEPYLMHLRALDQKLEFANDFDNHLTTFGLAVEGRYKKFDWGFEAALNHGNADIKAWDRNGIQFGRNSDGLIQEYYAYVFNEDPATTSSPTRAIVTDANKAMVAGGARDVAANGQPVIPGASIYNAFNRFRPAQKSLFEGFFFLADFSYQCIDDFLKCTFGAGYASGGLDKQLNQNNLTPTELNNQAFDGFIPVQSVYSGTRLRHLIVFNEGIPRFNLYNPNGTFTNQNVTPTPPSQTVEFRNIFFAGVRTDWNIRSFKDNKVWIAPNIIFYGVAEAPETKEGTIASNFLGTEILLEASAVVYKKIKLYAYTGLFLPGQYYKDMAGTPLNYKAPTLTTGSDVAFIANLGMSYSF